MKKEFILRRCIPILLVICLLCPSLLGCDMISSKHLEKEYESNDNEDIHGWGDNAQNWDGDNVTTWDNIEEYEYEDVVFSELLFDDILTEAPIVDCVIMDYRSNGKYFDGELVYSLVNDKFDANSFVAKYAVGTGVIVICVILTIATSGASTPVACFFAGAADASISNAVKFAAFGAATKAVTSAIKSGGDISETIYGALEGSSDGYMWGAIYGAATGGFNSQYCFVGDTAVSTESGLMAIADIHTGDKVLAYNPDFDEFGFKAVTQVTSRQATETVIVSINGESYESTCTHPYFTDQGWKQAGDLVVGDNVKTKDGQFSVVTSIERNAYQDPIDTYTLCVEDYHSFVIGENGAVVHNNCNINSDYADKRKPFPEGSPQAEKYPNGVLFSKDANGKVWARFEEYAEMVNGKPAIVKFDPGVLKGNCSTAVDGDFGMTLKALGLKKMPAGCTIHHVEDGQTMILIKQEIHSVAFGGMAHTGGESVIRAMIAAATP